jgi:hypothetical protein
MRSPRLIIDIIISLDFNILNVSSLIYLSDPTMFGWRSYASLTSSKTLEKEIHFDASVNANAEKLRSQFVQHEDKKELVVQACGTRYTVDFGALAHTNDPPAPPECTFKLD